MVVTKAIDVKPETARLEAWKAYKDSIQGGSMKPLESIFLQSHKLELLEMKVNKYNQDNS